MTAITTPRAKTRRRENTSQLVRKMAAVKVYAGTLVALNASGYLTNGAAATTLKDAAVAMETVDNSGGAAGDKDIRVEKGCYQFENSASGDLITIADIGNNCYIVDNQTVAKTDGSSTRSVAGKIVDVDAQGVWVSLT